MINEQDNLSQLPKGWMWTSFEQISKDLRAGGTPSTKIKRYYENGTIPFVKIKDIVGSKKYLYDTRTKITEEGLRNSSAWLVPKGSLLYSMYASYGEPIINKIEVATSQAIIAYIPPDSLMALDYIYYYLKKIRPELTTRGTTQRNLNAQIVRNIPIPLPPFPEQARIVAEIDELFSKLDAGLESLKQVRTQLQRYRQTVLKHAFEGKLTKDWREAHKDEIEHSSVLLEHIKEERRKNAKRKYKELPPLATFDLPKLPENWVWTRVGEISETIQYGTSEKAGKDPTGIPVMRMGNIQNGKLIFDNLKYFPTEWPRLSDFVLQDGDVLFNRTNSAELVGKTAVYKKHYPKAVFASYLIRVRTNKNTYDPDILAFFINSFYGRKYIASVVSQQVGQANVNGTKLSLMSIPLIPPLEQCKIVEEIERSFSVTDHAEKLVEQSLKQAERLRQSILKKAFEGKLVAQDPTDGSAKKLLERIKEERERSKAGDKTEKSESSPKQMELVRYVK